MSYSEHQRGRRFSSGARGSYIFLDESGDLGFDFKKKRTTKYFVVTVLFTANKRPIEKVVKKTHAELRKKYKRRRGALHCVKERPLTRKRLLKRLAEKDCSILAICLNKKKVYTKLRDEKAVLYNYVTNILLDRMYSKKLVPLDKKINLIASKRETNKFLNKNFRDYLKTKVKGEHKADLGISIKTPSREKALQAVDFASWAIFRKYEHRNDSYHKLIKRRIIEESPLFP